MSRPAEPLIWKADDEVGVRRQSEKLDRLFGRVWKHATKDPRLFYAPSDDPAEMARRAEVRAELDATADGERLIPDLAFAIDTFPTAFTDYSWPLRRHLLWTHVSSPQSPSASTFALLKRRVLFFLEGGYWTRRPARPHEFVGEQPFPTLRDCAQLLERWRTTSSDCERLVRDIVFEGLGDGDARIPDKIIEASRGKHGDLASRRTTHRLFAFDLLGLYGSIFASDLEVGAMTYEQFRRAALRSLACFGSAIGAPEEKIRGRFERKLLEEALDGWKGDREDLLDRFTTTAPRGGRYLVRACQFVTAGVPSTDLGTCYEFPQRVLRFLAGVGALEAGETDETLAAQLGGFPRPTLEMFLPFGGAARNALLRALGWADAESLVAFIHRVQVVNSSDPSVGRIDRTEALDCLRQAGDELARKIIDIHRRAKRGKDDVLILLEACRGWNDKEIRKGLARHGQTKVKALGLLPIESDTVVERYLTLKGIEDEASRHGPEQQANLRAAVAIGIDHLAQTAGASDTDSFVIDMELQMAGDVKEKSRARCGDYDVELLAERAGWSIRIEKGGKTLKSVPSAVRKSPEWEELQEHKDSLLEQSSRFRRFFEAAMESGKALEGTRLVKLGGLMAGAPLVSRLLFAQEDGRFVHFDKGRFLRLDGVPAAGSEFRVPHVASLSDSQLREAQAAVVRLQWRQPFKQAFREFYQLTDREREATASLRAAGHVVSSAVATRLLQSRGWNQKSSDIPEISKRFPWCGVIAHFTFPDARHFLASIPTVTTGEIAFVREYRRVPLAEVPAVVFSEVARDADLVAAIARSGEDQFSDAAYDRRAQAVQLIAERLGAKNLSIDGRFIVVKGKHARYRVHVGSATAFLDSGKSLALRPSTSVATDPYLPFAEDDAAMVEAINKVVFLANDAAATDASFLKQIGAGLT